MVNISSQKACFFLSFETVDTKWVGDQENMNIHNDDGAPDDASVELQAQHWSLLPSCQIDRARAGDSTK